MKKLLAVLTIISCCLLLTTGSGCLKSSLAEVVKAMGQDTNSVQIKITTIYGSGEVRRNMPPMP